MTNKRKKKEQHFTQSKQIYIFAEVIYRNLSSSNV